MNTPQMFIDRLTTALFGVAFFSKEEGDDEETECPDKPGLKIGARVRIIGTKRVSWASNDCFIGEVGTVYEWQIYPGQYCRVKLDHEKVNKQNLEKYRNWEFDLNDVEVIS